VSGGVVCVFLFFFFFFVVFLWCGFFLVGVVLVVLKTVFPITSLRRQRFLVFPLPVPKLHVVILPRLRFCPVIYPLFSHPFIPLLPAHFFQRLLKGWLPPEFFLFCCWNFTFSPRTSHNAFATFLPVSSSLLFLVYMFRMLPLSVPY